MATKAEVKLQPEGALALLDAHDEEGITYHFVALGKQALGGAALRMEVDGLDSGTIIRLWPNGTWEAKTEINVSTE